MGTLYKKNPWEHLYDGWHLVVIMVESDKPLTFSYMNSSQSYKAWPKWTPHLRPIARPGGCYMVLQHGAPGKTKDYQVHGAALLHLVPSDAAELNRLTLSVMEYVHARGTPLEHDPVFLALLAKYMPMSIYPGMIAATMPSFNELMLKGPETLNRWYTETGDERYARLAIAYHELVTPDTERFDIEAAVAEMKAKKNS